MPFLFLTAISHLPRLGPLHRMRRMGIVSVAQVSPAANFSDSIQKVRDFAAQAAAAKSSLVVFPEALIGGYPRGSQFGAVVGERGSDREGPGQVAILAGPRAWLMRVNRWRHRSAKKSASA